MSSKRECTCYELCGPCTECSNRFKRAQKKERDATEHRAMLREERQEDEPDGIRIKPEAMHHRLIRESTTKELARDYWRDRWKD